MHLFTYVRRGSSHIVYLEYQLLLVKFRFTSNAFVYMCVSVSLFSFPLLQVAQQINYARNLHEELRQTLHSQEEENVED